MNSRIGILTSHRLRFEAAQAAREELMLNHMGDERGFKDEDDGKVKNRFLNPFVYK